MKPKITIACEVNGNWIEMDIPSWSKYTKKTVATIRARYYKHLYDGSLTTRQAVGLDDIDRQYKKPKTTPMVFKSELPLYQLRNAFLRRTLI